MKKNKKTKRFVVGMGILVTAGAIAAFFIQYARTGEGFYLLLSVAAIIFLAAVLSFAGKTLS